MAQHKARPVPRTDGRETVVNVGQRPRRVTIHDVAAAAGVAASTVSRAFSHPERLTVETRNHVMAVADELGYRPSPIARAMQKGQTRTIALFVGDITNPYFFGLIRGAERQAAAADYTLVLTDNESLEAERKNIERLTRAVDGFVLGTSYLTDEDLRRLIKDHSVVTVNRPIRGMSHVVTDNEQGMRQAVEHLASLGHQTIAYLSGGSALTWTDKSQWRALKTTGDQLGLTITRLGRFPATFAGGAAAADAAIGTGTTAVVAFNDMLALGVLRRLSDRQVKVPEQISVMGVDDIFGADFCSPRLTTIRADMERAGRLAAELLLTAFDSTNQRPQRAVVSSELVIRDSTGAAPSELLRTYQ